MKAAYEHQKPESVIEAADPEIIVTGMQMRNAVLDQYRQKYAGTSHRILFLNPPYGVGLYWFNDLAQCLNHCGITNETIEIHDVQMPDKWEAFQPTVIIGLDSPDYLRTLDLDFITQYKKEKGLLRLFTPISTYRFPKPGLSNEDHWRLDLAKSGRSVDAYFSMMHENFFETFQSPWHQAGFKYLCLPFAANPLKHHLREPKEIHGNFMVASFGYERVFLMHRYIQSIFKKNHGFLAGTDCRFGIGLIPTEETPKYCAQTKTFSVHCSITIAIMPPISPSTLSPQRPAGPSKLPVFSQYQISSLVRMSLFVHRIQQIPCGFSIIILYTKKNGIGLQ
jgi:hypothetical protein